MARNWSDEDIESILRQLNTQKLPFEKYEVVFEQEKAKLLGRGSTANVYRARTRGKQKPGYALKVIGFGNEHAESKAFCTMVEAQKELCISQDNIVKIYDSAELLVWIEGKNTVVKAQKAEAEKERPAEGNYLHLQFILMEEGLPVLTGKRFGNPTLKPERLAKFDEEEILKLAHDIGTALAKVHARKLIHRDVKLENIFYSAKRDRYKLGDFGIARATDDGMASTVAFTKGYGAPEVVGTLEDRYDCTADIYSFGILLYVLLNELRFPGSQNYHPNVMQYTREFQAEYPTRGTDGLCRIVLKMISFDPDDRYQSMEEVLNEFDRLKYGRRLKYQREHRTTSLVLGAAFAFLGAVACELSHAFAAEFSVWMYLFFGMCIIKGIAKQYPKNRMWINLAVVCLGTAFLLTTEFRLWKLCLVIFASLFADLSAAVLGGAAFLLHFTYLVMGRCSLSVLPEYRWIAALLLTLSIALLFYHELLEERDEWMTKLYLGRNLYWLVIFGVYLALVVTEAAIRCSAGDSFSLYKRLFGEEGVAGFLQWDPLYTGVAGMIFCAVWIAREGFLLLVQKRLERESRAV